MDMINIFILAAGHGERLLPITNQIPKPLIPILGKPILQTIVERVSALHINKIGINLHHNKDAIKDWILHSKISNMIELFQEEPILGTGGALKNAEAFLQDRIFIVHNADILSDIDLGKIVEAHLSSENLVTLAVHDYPQFNNVAVNEKGFLLGVGKKNKLPSQSSRWLAFTGIAVYSPNFLAFLPHGPSSVVDAWVNALRGGYKIGTFDVSGCFWSDVGTPASYAKAIVNCLRRNGESVFIHPSSSGCKDAKLDGYIIIEKECSFKKDVSLRNCIMLPGTSANPPTPPLPKGGKGRVLSKGGKGRVLPKGRKGGFLSKGDDRVIFENCIIGPGFTINLNDSELFGSTEIPGAVLIGTGGSDRKYFRIKRNGQSQVLMQCASRDPDFQRHIVYSKFFKEHSVPVPELIEADFEHMSAVLEDLGDLSLYSWLKCMRDRKQVEHIYKKVLDMLISIHTSATAHVAECPILQSRLLDYEHLRWETEYFIERFVKGIRNIVFKNISALNNDFHRLASEVDSFPKTIIHRDFQSQNIMITNWNIPRLLDYQGARIGPPAYDVVSILWDPYYRLEDVIREKLFDYYISQMEMNPPSTPFKKGGEKGVLKKEGEEGVLKRKGKGEALKREGHFNKKFRNTLLPCRLQRHMQALGAYGFLSLKKGKRYFLKHVPEGLRLLKEDAVLARETYPTLYDLVMRL